MEADSHFPVFKTYWWKQLFLFSLNFLNNMLSNEVLQLQDNFYSMLQGEQRLDGSTASAVCGSPWSLVWFEVL